MHRDPLTQFRAHSDTYLRLAEKLPQHHVRVIENVISHLNRCELPRRYHFLDTCGRDRALYQSGAGKLRCTTTKRRSGIATKPPRTLVCEEKLLCERLYDCQRESRASESFIEGLLSFEGDPLEPQQQAGVHDGANIPRRIADAREGPVNEPEARTMTQAYEYVVQFGITVNQRFGTPFGHEPTERPCKFRLAPDERHHFPH